eukprot:NODE_15650_length_1038_cov_19.717892.p1 GENE.NODE_15650_length_1038_cov_19.717892~~NODE_15650_length_1038_cov_19.717892.p1  ORF type:complete len:285 (+),score=23.62 NODE_15650_length_1038_cov_19.717892:47-856(+)
MVNTRFVLWLRRWPYVFDLVTLTLLVASGSLGAFQLVTYPTERVTYTVPSTGEQHTVNVLDMDMGMTMTAFVCMQIFNFLALHDYNRDLSFMAAQSFDGIMIGGSFTLVAVAREADVVLVLVAADQWSLTALVKRSTTILLLLSLLHLFYCMDAFRVRPGKASRMKLFFCGMTLLTFAFDYLFQRFVIDEEADPRWSKLNTCFWIGGCMPLRTVYLTSELHLIVYLTKMCLQYSKGCGLALPRVSYYHCECAAIGVVAQVSEQMCHDAI